jgi:glycogen debranching enzyme
MSPEQELLQLNYSATTIGTKIFDPLDSLRISIGEYSLWKAGNNNYERPFFRDSVIAATFLKDPQGLKEVLRFAASIQGTKKDPRTGEQPGSIFHEYDPILNDGVELPDRSGKTTLYNACDSNALFILGHEEYIHLTGDVSFKHEQEDNINSAIQYILRHLDANNLFVIDPKHSDAERYALRVTYWKDSHLKGREDGEPLYPVIYSLSHIQNMAGLRSAGRLSNSKEISKKAEDMKGALVHLFDNQIDTLSIAIDRGGRISGVSSDVLHALNYLEPGDIDPSTLERFLVNSRILETSMGYRTLSPEHGDEVTDSYHAKTVWTHEQAIINSGAKKHLIWADFNGFKTLKEELLRVEEVSSRVVPFMKQNPNANPELFLITSTGDIEPGGCDPQLWAIAARKYFIT